MSNTNQQGAGEEEWEEWRKRLHEASGDGWDWWEIVSAAHELIAECLLEADADQILADHATARRARKLEERVRELETGISDVAFWLSGYAPVQRKREWIEKRARALLSPTTGKEDI